MSEYRWRVGENTTIWEPGHGSKAFVLDQIAEHGLYDEGSDWWVEIPVAGSPHAIDVRTWASAIEMLCRHLVKIPHRGVCSISSTGMGPDAHWYTIQRL